MPQTPPTSSVDDIVVVGQRRRNNTTNPYPGGPTIPDPLPPGMYDEILPIDPGEPHPCDIPGMQEDWNSDAASQVGRRQIESEAAAAGENGLTYRERGFLILKNHNGGLPIVRPSFLGTIFLPGAIPSTAFDLSGINPADIIGFGHNHNIGQHAPSYDPTTNYGDAEALEGIASIVDQFGGNGNAVRMYIFAQTSGPNPYNKTSVYTRATATAASRAGAVGPEVNPNAQYCPIR